jgi:hypothetical protein
MKLNPAKAHKHTAKTLSKPITGSHQTLKQYAYLVMKSSDKIFFYHPISILGDKIFYLSPNINLRPKFIFRRYIPKHQLNWATNNFFRRLMYAFFKI